MNTYCAHRVGDRPGRRGFTLIELMVVIMILGVIAAIVIPRITDASSQAREAGIAGQLQVIRRQVELYKHQCDALPDLVTNWDPMMNSGTAGEPPTTVGPFLVVQPHNPLNGKENVIDGDGSANPGAPCGFVYDYNNGAGTGKIYATDRDGTTLLPE